MADSRTKSPNQDPSSLYFIHPSDANSLQLVSVKFNGSGFNNWKRSMMLSLSAKNKLGFLDGSIEKPDVASNEYKAWERCNDLPVFRMMILFLVFWGNYLRVNKKDEEVFFVHAQDRESDIYIDLSLNNEIAPFASAFVRAVVDLDISNRIFLVLIKQFAQHQDLNNDDENTLSSIGHTYLGIFFLMMNNSCPQFLKKENIFEVSDLVIESKGYKTISNSFSRPSSVPTLENLFLGFFTYYSQDKIFENMAISLRGGCLVSKESLNWHANGEGCCLGIVDPFSGENVGKDVDDVEVK